MQNVKDSNHYIDHNVQTKIRNNNNQQDKNSNKSTTKKETRIYKHV